MKRLPALALTLLLWLPARAAEPKGLEALRGKFDAPTEESAPWIFWYWMNGAVTKEGITADLEAMKEIGLEGTYLMPIRDSSRVQFMDNCVLQGTPKWWEMVEYSVREADRLGLKMGLHICDGFALAGGPWITPEQSMQKVVYSSTVVEGGTLRELALATPDHLEGYYEDIAVFALPVKGLSQAGNPVVSLRCSTGEDVSGLLDGSYKLRSTQPLWVDFCYEEPFTMRSVSLQPSGTNYQALRWTVSASDDGVNFKEIKRFIPARRGWQDTDAPNTYSIPETTARYFRFYWTPTGTEPGTEDMDAAKWKPELLIRRITPSNLPLLENFEGKSGLVWRLSPRQDSSTLPTEQCVPLKDIVNLSDKMDAAGVLHNVKLDSSHRWMILRMGHTSTGHRNDTGGGAKGLECDKFDAEAVRCQFDHWFGEAYRQIDNDLLHRVLVRLHSDSWECGSQNWSKNFLQEFKQRRQYDLLPYLPLYAGIPIESAEVSEAVLYDLRLTVSELITDIFFGTLSQLAGDYGCLFSSESVAPTMLSDGMSHYDKVDLPMGEYWLDSPSHDKPNDMFDAISSAHVYGKNLVQAEGFTQLRALWKEYPGMLKSLGDFNLAFGMNKLFFHVFCQHPFPGKYPGMTLDGIGLYMHGSQTWWPYATEWVDYLKRCQTMLQWGRPVADIAVFSGENLPSRSVLPDKLVPSLSGLFGDEACRREARRNFNEGQPVKKTSVEVTVSANMVTADMWVDPLGGYRYDGINRDALLRLAKAENGRMVLPGGASYRVLVMPRSHAMAPDGEYLSQEVLDKVNALQQAGVVVLLSDDVPVEEPSYTRRAQAGEGWETDFVRHCYLEEVKEVWDYAAQHGQLLPYDLPDLTPFGLLPDIRFHRPDGSRLDRIGWNHRSDGISDLWFITNQTGEAQELTVKIRHGEARFTYWDPLSGERFLLPTEQQGEQAVVKLFLDTTASGFIVAEPLDAPIEKGLRTYEVHRSQQRVTPKWAPWTIRFDRIDKTLTGVKELFDWSQSEDKDIRYYSGNASYTTTFNGRLPKKRQRVYLEMEHLDVAGSVKVNGKDCGIVWASPCRVDITDAVKSGKNSLEISMANTWYNYSQAVNYHMVEDDNYWTNGRTWDYNARLTEPAALQPSGLYGTLELIVE